MQNINVLTAIFFYFSQKVTVRLRPLNSKEALKSEFETVKILDEHVLALLDPGYELNPDDVSPSRTISFVLSD